MNARTAAILLRTGTALLGAMWILAAAFKLLGPESSYEFTVRLVGTGVAAKPVLAAWVAAEAGIGVAMLLGAMRGLVPTAALLAAASAALFVVRSRYNGRVSCGCMGLVADESVDVSLLRNAVLFAVVAALYALARITSRRSTRPGTPAAGAEAASGPATPSP